MGLPAVLDRIPSATDLAWAAGIVDGEGCITISRRAPKPEIGRKSISHNIFLKITMGHRPTIDKLYQMFNVGSVHIQDRQSPKLNDSWTWLTSSRNTHAVLLLIRPYLVTKAYEADLGLKFLQGNFKAGGKGVVLNPVVVQERDRIYELMRDAKPTARFRVAS